MKELNNQIIIKCPKCGYEYLASEIFYPEQILGKAKEVLRDDNGNILWVTEDEESCLEEDWECDRCHCDFKAKLDIKPISIYDKGYDFSEDYSISCDEDKEKLF